MAISGGAGGGRIAAACGAALVMGALSAAPTATQEKCRAQTRLVEAQVDAGAAAKYLLGHQKPNGAFGPHGHDHTDLAWNYPAVHALTILKRPIPRPEDCFNNGRGAIYKQKGSHDASRAWDLYQRAQLAAVMGRKGKTEPPLDGNWKLEFRDREGQYYFRLPENKLNARAAPFCDIPTLHYLVSAVTTSGGKISNPQTARDFLLPRQTPSGAFVDAYRADPPPNPRDAHVAATAQAILTLKTLGFDIPRPDKCAEWIRSCQDDSGGFRWNPSHPAPSNKPDAWYAWSAALALHALGAKPRDPDRALAWINSLQNPDGGFGDHPGWESRLYSTYYAVHALDLLTGDAPAAIKSKKASIRRRVIPDGAYSIFQAHLKSPPGGRDMVDAARKMGFHLLGVKDNSPGTQKFPVEESRAWAREKRYPLEILSCPEQYAYKLLWHGGHPANHVANFLYPPDPSPEQKARLEEIDRAGREGLPWDAFRERVIAPVLAMGSLFYPELDYEMMNAYRVYDDGLDGGAGYNAVIGALGWPVWDWIRFFPYRERWAGKLPIIVDGDAHGDLAKWGDRLDRQRLLYLAPRHDLKNFLEACRDGRTVCVIRGGEDKSELAFYGDPAAVEHVRRRRKEWQWWD